MVRSRSWLGWWPTTTRPARGTPRTLSFNSRMIRSAVFRPTPGIALSLAMSPSRMAGINSSTAIPDRILAARRGPIPDTPVSPDDDGQRGKDHQRQTPIEKEQQNGRAQDQEEITE